MSLHHPCNTDQKVNVKQYDHNYNIIDWSDNGKNDTVGSEETIGGGNTDNQESARPSHVAINKGVV